MPDLAEYNHSDQVMTENRDVVNLLLLILLFPLHLIAKLIPPDKRLFLFGSSLGRHFADNSKYLYLYASDHLPQVKAVFVSQNRQVVDLIRAGGRRAEYLYSLGGIKVIVRARRSFLSHKIKDIRLVRIGTSEIIQLWHGTPLKKINHDVEDTGTGRNKGFRLRARRLIFRLFPYLDSGVAFDRIVASSEAVCPSFVTAFRIPKDRIFIGGQPRNDCLVGQVQMQPEVFPEAAFITRLTEQYRHICVWMPTHRASDTSATMNDLLNRYGFDEGRMLRLLEETQACLVVKAHFIEHNNMRERFAGNSRVIVYDHADPYPLLSVAEVLITDYSSVMFDFLLTGRPIVFAPFDLEEYRRTTAEFYYDYAEVTPGPKCSDWEQVEHAIRQALQVPDEFAHQREVVRDRFNKYTAGCAARIAAEFLSGDE